MKVAGDWIETPATQAVCAMLNDAGHQALFVGGCIRNALLREPVSDIDIATDALPERVIELAENAGLKPVPTGLQHGTVTVVADHIPHEITTFRKDVETHGRHAVVAFSDDILDDARRRDFTMNALYARADGTVVDPLGGMDDLRARRVRFIDDAGQRIREDFLRILRFFRFHAWYGDPLEGLDTEGLAAIATHVDGLASLSRERIGAEIVKLLAAPDPAMSVAAMHHAGVMRVVLPGADDRYLAPLVHIESDFGIAAEPLRRLACLGGEDPVEPLRLSNTQARQLDLLRNEISSTKGAAELGYRYGVKSGLDILILRSALLEQRHDPESAQILEKGASSHFPIRATDLMPDYAGPALGARLKELEQRWVASDFSLTKEELVRL